MTVESLSYISGLNTSWPLNTDAKSEGDNHLRLIKSAIKDSFPNINGPVTVTDEELNYLSSVSSNIQTQLNGLSATISAMTTRLNNLSTSLTTLHQSISALTTLAYGRPSFGACAYRTTSDILLTSAASSTLAFDASYYNVSSMFVTANSNVVAPTGTRFVKLRAQALINIPTGSGGVTMRLQRGSSAMSSLTISAGGVAETRLFDIRTPYLTATAGETFCVLCSNTTTSTATVVANSSAAIVPTFEADFIAWQ